MKSRVDMYEQPIGVKFRRENDGREISGQLTLTKGDLFNSNVVQLVDDKSFHIKDHEFLHGISAAGKVSLIDCVNGHPLAQTSWGDFDIHHGDVCFRYAIFGKKHITADQECIHGMQFALEGLRSSVFATDVHRTFGHISKPSKKITEAIAQHKPRHLPGRFVRDSATVSYFTGNSEFLASFETVLGTIRIMRVIHADFFGRGMVDTPIIVVDFLDNPTTLDGAWEKMRIIRQFFAWMIGYIPDWEDTVVYTAPLCDRTYATDDSLDVFSVEDGFIEPRRTRRYDSLIDASENPQHFVEVMQKWLIRNDDEERSDANARFFSSLAARRYLEDGIVSAANTFDLLPEEDKPHQSELPRAVLGVLRNASKEIKKICMEKPFERNSVLNALGNIRANSSLRAVVGHRARVVLNHCADNELRGLSEVIQLAVKCRNYYTHGTSESKGRTSLSDPSVVRFLTDTLEFIYGTSELLLCGWDMSKCGRGSHPLTRYIREYDYNRTVTLGRVP